MRSVNWPRRARSPSPRSGRPEASQTRIAVPAAPLPEGGGGQGPNTDWADGRRAPEAATAGRESPSACFIRPSDRRGPGRDPRPQCAFEKSVLNVSCNSHQVSQLAAFFIDP